MKALCAELRDEYVELANLVEGMSAAQWQLKSKFYGWTPFDEISHLLFFDERGLLAASDAEAFAADTAAIVRFQILMAKSSFPVKRQSSRSRTRSLPRALSAPRTLLRWQLGLRKPSASVCMRCVCRRDWWTARRWLSTAINT